jgi:hypothetical protein
MKSVTEADLLTRSEFALPRELCPVDFVPSHHQSAIAF